MRCPQCGFDNWDWREVCTRCGTSLGSSGKQVAQRFGRATSGPRHSGHRIWRSLGGVGRLLMGALVWVAVVSLFLLGPLMVRRALGHSGLAEDGFWAWVGVVLVLLLIGGILDRDLLTVFLRRPDEQERKVLAVVCGLTVASLTAGVAAYVATDRTGWYTVAGAAILVVGTLAALEIGRALWVPPGQYDFAARLTTGAFSLGQGSGGCLVVVVLPIVLGLVVGLVLVLLVGGLVWAYRPTWLHREERSSSFVGVLLTAWFFGYWIATDADFRVFFWVFVPLALVALVIGAIIRLAT